MKIISPLRYPGGKAILYDKVKKIVVDNKLTDMIYVEPFAGGFGLGIKLMTNNIINSFIINDYDYHIYAFWKVLFTRTKDLINFINNVNVTLNEWIIQKEIYINYKNYNLVEIACSTLFLNRTNYSGVLTGGPIGGQKQIGNYKIDCRFNKQKLTQMIEELSKYKSKVKVYNYDAIKLIKKLKEKQNLFYNFDPPYVSKGKELYANFYENKDHILLGKTIDRLVIGKWIMTYDNNDLIKNLYQNYNIEEFVLPYFAGKKKKGTELFIKNFI